MPKSNKENATELLSQMIEVSELLDSNKKEKDKLYPEGESWMTFHLKTLQELIKNME